MKGHCFNNYSLEEWTTLVDLINYENFSSTFRQHINNGILNKESVLCTCISSFISMSLCYTYNHGEYYNAMKVIFDVAYNDLPLYIGEIYTINKIVSWRCRLGK